MSSLFEQIGSILEGLKAGEFDWVINMCSSDAIFKTSNSAESPRFSFASSLWYVKITHNNVFNDYISLYLYKEDSKVQNYVTLSFKMIFLGMEVKVESTPVHFKTTNSYYGCPMSISRKQLLDLWTQTSKDCCELIIRIRIRDYVPRDEDASVKIRLKGREILSQNYKDMLVDGEDHDLVLKVKEKEFKAHRNIMKSRCPVFKTMLTHEMLDKNSGVVDIPDCDPSAFEQFLLYIYTGELNTLDESTMLGLYFIADKYDMENLREECCVFIKKSLSVNVICDVIKLALDHSDSSLLEIATKYFISNAKEIYVTVEWMSFIKENPIEANKLIIKAFNECSYCCVRRSEVSVSDSEEK